MWNEFYLIPFAFFNEKKTDHDVKLTLSWRRPLSYRNQSIDLLSKSMDWFLHDNGLRHERVKLIVNDNHFWSNKCNHPEKYVNYK